MGVRKRALFLVALVDEVEAFVGSQRTAGDEDD